MELEQIYQRYLRGEISLQQLQQAIQNSPEQAAYVQQQIDAQRRGEKVALSQGFLDLAKNIGLAAYSKNQIRQAQANEPVMPSIPSVPGLSPELSQAIYEAQRGVATSPTLAPARQGIEDAYTGNLNFASNASGGQAGAYQAMGQLANIERMRALQGLAPLAQQVQMQNQGNLNDLLSARVNERQAQYNNQLYASQQGLDNYWNQIQGLSGQVTAGNQNLLNSSERISNSLQNLSPYYAGFDPETRDYMEKVRKENISNFNSSQVRNPSTFYSGMSHGQDPFPNIG
jgi:hypothetical protein